MRSPGLLVLLAVVCAQLTAGNASARRFNTTQRIVSPDGQHQLVLTAGGAMRLDGRSVTGLGKLLAAPVWRRDSRALAMLQRAPAGVQLVVLLLDTDPGQPLVWSLPTPVETSCRQVFWIAPQRVGVGETFLVPRVVVSWTSTLASAEGAPSTGPWAYDMGEGEPSCVLA